MCLKRVVVKASHVEVENKRGRKERTRGHSLCGVDFVVLKREKKTSSANA